MEAHERIRGVFRPQCTDDLQCCGEIGKTYTFEAGWIIEGGPYDGQWAFVPVDYTRDAPALKYFGWVPECDIEIVMPEAVRREEDERRKD